MEPQAKGAVRYNIRAGLVFLLHFWIECFHAAGFCTREPCGYCTVIQEKYKISVRLYNWNVSFKTETFEQTEEGFHHLLDLFDYFFFIHHS